MIINTTADDVRGIAALHNTTSPECPCHISPIFREYAELLDRLPRLADGVVAMIGMDVWIVERSKFITKRTIVSMCDRTFGWGATMGCANYANAYSTLEGAEARVREMNDGK